MRPIARACVMATSGVVLCARGQSVAGSATVIIDPIANIVVATCETDVDASSEAIYAAGVKCTVKNARGVILAEESGTDEGKGQGYVTCSLLLKGEPGTTYDVDGEHFVVPLLSEPDNLVVAPSGGVSWLTDPFHYARMRRFLPISRTTR